MAGPEVDKRMSVTGLSALRARVKYLVHVLLYSAALGASSLARPIGYLMCCAMASTAPDSRKTGRVPNGYARRSPETFAFDPCRSVGEVLAVSQLVNEMRNSAGNLADRGLDDDHDGTESCRRIGCRRGECILLSAGFRVLHPVP